MTVGMSFMLNIALKTSVSPVVLLVTLVYIGYTPPNKIPSIESTIGVFGAIIDTGNVSIYIHINTAAHYT